MTTSRIALELFSGKGTFSCEWRRCVGLRGIPIFEVDVASGDGADLLVRRNQTLVRGWIRCGWVVAVWMGTPCNSFSRARENPNWSNVQPLRSDEHPLGLPGLLPHNQAKVTAGNTLARFSAGVLLLAARCGVPATVENPATSRIWKLPCFVQVARHPAARSWRSDFCQDGTPWRKRTRLLSVHVNLSDATRLCSGRGVCSRSGRPHRMLEGSDLGVPLTQLAEPYPRGLCARLCRAYANHFRAERSGKVASFFRPG